MMEICKLKKLPTHALITACLLSLTCLAAQTTSIDIMVVYTPAARAEAGSQAAMEADIMTSVASTNEAFANSEIDIELILVHVAEVDYTEASDYNTDLTRLRVHGNGFMDEVHEWRDAYGADLVSLFRRGPSSGVVGMANLLDSEDGNPELAFNVISDVTATSSLTFAHEVGHNMGSAHAHGDDSSTGLFPYSHGHRIQNGTYNTIMATFNPGETRIPYFSNPDISYEGDPTGVPEGEPNEANNAKTFAFTGPLIADYREHQPEIPEIADITDVNKVVSGQSALLGAVVRGRPDIELQWYSGDSGDTDEPISGATEATYQTDPINHTRSIWLRASNQNGHGDSPTLVLEPTTPPSGPYAIDQSQEDGNTILGEDFGPRWQEFIPEWAYLDSVEVMLRRDGSPGNTMVEITTQTGLPLVRHTLAESDTPTGTPDWVSIPTGIFLQPGTTYRIALSTPGANGADDVLWVAGSGNLYPAGDGNYQDFNYRFITRGAPVTEAERILALSGNLDFGELFAGDSATRTLTLENTGNDTLNISNLTFPDGFSGDWTSGSLDPGVNQNVSITFAPENEGSYSGLIVIDSDKTSGDNSIAVSGSAIESDAGDAPPSFDIGLRPNIKVATGGRAYLAVAVSSETSVSYQWYEGESGDTSNPVTAATANAFIPPPLNDDTAYWVRVWNDGGETDSDTVKIEVATAPPAWQADQIQDTVNHGYILSVDLWQEFVPQHPFLAAVEVDIQRQGSPGDLVFAIADSSFRPFAERSIAQEDISSGRRTILIEVGVFLNPGDTYLLVLREPATEADENDHYVWFGADENPYSAGQSNLESQAPGWDFAFRTIAGAENGPPIDFDVTGNPGDNWFTSAWLGTYHDGELEADDHGWIHHREHGWWWLDTRRAVDDNGIFIFDPRPGHWLWTKPEFYPFLYAYGLGWLYYQEASVNPRWFYRYQIQDWINFTPQ